MAGASRLPFLAPSAFTSRDSGSRSGASARGVRVHYSYQADAGDSWSGVFDLDNLAAAVTAASNYRLLRSGADAGGCGGDVQLQVSGPGLCWDQSPSLSSRLLLFSETLADAIRGGATWSDLLAIASFRINQDGAMVIHSGDAGSNLLGVGGRIRFREASVAAGAGRLPLLRAAAAFCGVRRQARRPLHDLRAC